MTSPKRRDFLKMAALPLVPKVAASGPIGMPTAESLASPAMPHRFGDLFNPPGLTNFLGCAQAALDVTAVRSVAYPPFAQGEISGGGTERRSDLTGILFVDGEYAAARKDAIEFVWRPDRIERRTVSDGLRLSSITIVPKDRMAVAVQLRVENTGRTHREVEVKFLLQGGVTRSVKPWGWMCPGESDNRATVRREDSAVVFEARQSAAVSAQAAWPAPSEITSNAFIFRLSLGVGEVKNVVFSDVIGERAAQVVPAAMMIARNFDAEARSATEEWNSVLTAAFTPQNRYFSGYLPVLTTTDSAVTRIYHTALATLLMHRRTTPSSVYGITYVTLAPRYWETSTFLWDISLGSIMLALLDPAVLRRMVETWMTVDIHKHFGTDFLTGEGVGPWYSVNDFAMCRMARDYVRWSGDRAWLDKNVGGMRVIDRLVSYARHWQELDKNHHGLADYGGVANLLEAVSSYVHEVAGLNAANVYCLRFVAELLDMHSEQGRAAALRQEASALVRRVLALYVPGAGTWNCRQPDGRLQTVRHCYDFGTVLSMISGDLSPEQKREMVSFFRRELQTPTWMRALSTRDSDVIFSVRPDHQWTGAYAAWPAISLTALYNAGEYSLAYEWMRGLARTAMQGPIAQAHFSETAVDPEAGGGARKAPSDEPWINDWACVGGSAFFEPILEGLFGVRAPLDGNLSATPRFAGSDPAAELRGLRYQGKVYHVSARGAESR
jgi:hypothetical protein